VWHSAVGEVIAQTIIEGGRPLKGLRCYRPEALIASDGRRVSVLQEEAWSQKNGLVKSWLWVPVGTGVEGRGEDRAKIEKRLKWSGRLGMRKWGLQENNYIYHELQWNTTSRRYEVGFAVCWEPTKEVDDAK